jgi:hypothetical protein
MAGMPDEIPGWLAELSDEDLQFIRRFVLASGSLKELARLYSVSYPTVRARLDRLIAKVQAVEDAQPNDPFERKIRVLVADGRLSPGLAKELMAAHKTSKGRSASRSQQGVKS